MDHLTDGIKKLLLAGVGAVATTADKSQEIFDDLVKKGELTVDQGKQLNQELKHTVKEKKEAADEKKAETEEKTVKSDDVKDSTADTAKDLATLIAGMTAEQLEELKSKIDEAEKKVKKDE